MRVMFPPALLRHLSAVLGFTVFAEAIAAQGHASHPPPADAASDGTAAFLSSAREGIKKYSDQRAAISAGFRRLGRDFPSMGEHWVHPGKVIAGRFDVADPAMLTYARIGGKPVLLGAVYAIPLERGQHPPPLPGRVTAWHEHNGTVVEESFLPEHSSEQPETKEGMRLAILHVWTELPNPGGIFAAENWALPFIRLGLVPPSTIPERAARALSLAAGGTDFYGDLFDNEDPTRRCVWISAFGTASGKVESLLASRRAHDRLSGEEISALEKTWSDLVASIAGRFPAVAKILDNATR